MKLPPIKTSSDIAERTTSSSSWILGICSVVFDIDVGQTLQFLYPEDCLSEEEQSSVAFHAFPDSLSMELYTRNAIRDSSFHFRIKRIPESYTDGMPDFLYGYVFCRQRQDESLRRGGEQIAVVVLSVVPFSGVLLPVSIAAGHAFFSEGEVALAQMYCQVAAWPAPVPGSRVSLPAGHAMITGQVPPFALLPPPQPTIHPSVQVTLLRRAQRQASIHRGGAIALAAGLSRRNSLQLQHSGSGVSSAAIAIAAEDSQQGSTAVDDTTVASAAAAAPGLETQDSSGAAAAAAVAASWMSAHTAGSLPTSPTGSGWSILGSDSTPKAAQNSTRHPNSITAPNSGDLGLNSSSSLSRFHSCSTASTGSNPGSTNFPGPFPLARTVSNSHSSPALLAAGLAGTGAVPNGSGEFCSQWISNTLGQHWKLETPFPEIDAAAVLQPLLRHAWTLWQLLITAQPLMVVGLTPRECSTAVAALMSLVAPLPYAADYRPYFTIHDPDFMPLSRGKLPQHNIYHEQLPQQLAVALDAACTQQQDNPNQTAVSQSTFREQSTEQQQQQQQNRDIEQSGLGSTLEHQPDKQQQQMESQLPVLLGITNLYFIKMLPHWPNVVSVSKKETVSRPSSAAGTTVASSSNQVDQQMQQPQSSGGALTGQAGSRCSSCSDLAAAESAASAAATTAAAPPRKAGLISSTAAAAFRAFKRHQQGPQHLLSDFSPHLWCCSKALVRPDSSVVANVTAVLEKEQQGAAGVAAVGGANGWKGAVAPGTANRQLRRHFADLTAAFLAPFDRYFEPGVNGMVPGWDADEFLDSLKPAALHPDLTARLAGSTATSAVALYSAFISSPNFAFWFSQHRKAVLHLVEQQYKQDVANEPCDSLADIQQEAPEAGQQQLQSAAVSAGSSSCGTSAGAEDEVTLVQAFLSAEQDLLAAQPQHGEQHQRALQAQLVSTFTSMPKDLQVALISSPARRQLLEQSLSALGEGMAYGSGETGEVESQLAVDLQQLQQLVQELGGCQPNGSS